MIATHPLVLSVEQTYSALIDQLDTAAAMRTVPGQPRKGFENADHFLAAASRHLNTIESVLLPVAQKQLSDDQDLVHDYVRASKDLEAALVIAKGREYGSAYAVSMRWEDVWATVRKGLDDLRRRELELAAALEPRLDETALDDLVGRMHRFEPNAPSRPHPHAPHLGLLGHLSRRFLHAVDSFWDTAEGRMVPERERPPHKEPGPMGQYLLGDPRFDEDD